MGEIVIDCHKDVDADVNVIAVEGLRINTPAVVVVVVKLIVPVDGSDGSVILH